MYRLVGGGVEIENISVLPTPRFRCLPHSRGFFYGYTPGTTHLFTELTIFQLRNQSIHISFPNTFASSTRRLDQAEVGEMALSLAPSVPPAFLLHLAENPSTLNWLMMKLFPYLF